MIVLCHCTYGQSLERGEILFLYHDVFKYYHKVGIKDQRLPFSYSLANRCCSCLHRSTIFLYFFALFFHFSLHAVIFCISSFNTSISSLNAICSITFSLSCWTPLSYSSKCSDDLNDVNAMAFDSIGLKSAISVTSILHPSSKGSSSFVFHSFSSP